MRQRTVLITLAACSALVPGCSVDRFGTGRVMRTAADERVVMAMPLGVGSEHGQVNPTQITCSEPSPDVQKILSKTTELASQLEAAATNPQTQLQGDVNATLALSTARAEAVTQLTQRLATIQLLRDGLYRACEAYANGAISDTAYALVLSRYGDVMVTMLLGELAAGKSPPLVALGSKAEGDANGNGGSNGGSDGTNTGTGASPHHAAIGHTHASAQAGPADGMQVIPGSNETPDAAIAFQLVALQKNYINNSQIGPLLVACVSALDRHSAGAPTPFATVCQQAMGQLNGAIPGILKARLGDADGSAAGVEPVLEHAPMSAPAIRRVVLQPVTP